LAQLFEAHADAIAIHDELDRFALPLRGIWGVWTTEAGRAQVVIDGGTGQAGDEVTISGRKARCSGAGIRYPRAGHRAGPLCYARPP
jgi:hypothetical protein